MWNKLYQAAVEVQNGRTVSPFIDAGGVAAAILTESGNIYVGVCIDTCHFYSAGYDIVGDYDGAFGELERVVGLEYLKAIHLNDTKKPLGSRVDRHDSVGIGLLGIDFFKRFMKDPRFDNMPIILETPDEARWAEEIALLRSFE